MGLMANRAVLVAAYAMDPNPCSDTQALFERYYDGRYRVIQENQSSSRSAGHDCPGMRN